MEIDIAERIEAILPLINQQLEWLRETQKIASPLDVLIVYGFALKGFKELAKGSDDLILQILSEILKMDTEVSND